MWGKFRSIFNSLTMVLTYMGAVSVLIMAAIIVYDVGMRYLFNKPTNWALEIGQYLMLATTFLPLAHVQKDKKHITVELFTSLLSVKTRSLLAEFIIPIFILLACGGLLWQFGILSLRLYTQQAVSVSTLRIPLFPISIILVLGILFIFIILVIQILGAIIDHISVKTKR